MKLILLTALLTGGAFAAEISFAGFPKVEPGKRTFAKITSDGVDGLLRPKWTRAMGDVGAWPAMFRFKDALFLSFPRVNGHAGRAKTPEVPIARFVSCDEGRTWRELPPMTGVQAGEHVVAGDTIFRYDFDTRRHTRVRTSTDGIAWSEPRDIYEDGLWLWGAHYDERTRTFWAPPHLITGKEPRQIHLATSKDGIEWSKVTRVHFNESESESTLRLEPDDTMLVLIRQKYGAKSWLATARPPYQDWQFTTFPFIVEGEHFFDIGGQRFVGSRADYKGDDAEISANPKLFGKRNDYSMIYRFTPDHDLVPWAIMDSVGDCSYPHLVETHEEVLCAYYSMHEDRRCKVFLCAYDKVAFLSGPTKP